MLLGKHQTGEYIMTSLVDDWILRWNIKIISFHHSFYCCRSFDTRDSRGFDVTGKIPCISKRSKIHVMHFKLVLEYKICFHTGHVVFTYDCFLTGHETNRHVAITAEYHT